MVVHCIEEKLKTKMGTSGTGNLQLRKSNQKDTQKRSKKSFEMKTIRKSKSKKEISEMRMKRGKELKKMRVK